MSQNKVFVSPGVYTSEKEILFSNKQMGVTSVGLAGETTKGPAFQPIFISNYEEFRRFFGGLNPKKISDGFGGSYPQYELPYIAKSFLSKSNQLYVTRVLGLSGYDSNLAWSIALESNLDPSSVLTGVTDTTILTYDIDTTNNLAGPITSSNPAFTTFLTENIFTIDFNTVSNGTYNQPKVFYKLNTTDFSGVSFIGVATATPGSGVISISMAVDFIPYTGKVYAEVEGAVIGMLRSRGKYTPTGLVYNVDAASDVTIDISSNAIKTAFNDPYGDFTIIGNNSAQTPIPFSHVVSLDKRKKNFISKVFGTTEKDGKSNLFVEELFTNTLNKLVAEGKVSGIKKELISHGDAFSDYKQEFSPAVTPYVVSELRDDKVLKLFRFITISDGDTANTEVKFSIANINLDSKTFDVQIRAFYDTDANPLILERFTKCSMDPNSSNYIARKIGSLDGEYVSRSNYVLIELDDDADTSEAVPAGFLGYPTRDYSKHTNTVLKVGIIKSANIAYKNNYSILENKRKVYLGLSSDIGIDSDFLEFKGNENITDITDGFHLDSDAGTVIIDSSTTSTPYKMVVTKTKFRDEAQLTGTDLETLNSRKFTLAAYGGFDGWDIYRDARTNDNNFVVNKFLTETGFDGPKLALNNLAGGVDEDGNRVINSDYYAYLQAYKTFENPEAVNINVFATPGIDFERNSVLTNEVIDMVELERADSVYIIASPNFDTEAEVIDALEDSGIDSNYSATFWPWVQKVDSENNVLINLPVTVDVIRNLAITDNIAFPWFAAAGIQRGDIECVRALNKLTLPKRDRLYEARINPVMSWSSEGVKIWGNKTLQLNESPLSSLNVRRLLLHTRKLISAVSIRLLFDQNDDIIRQKFVSLVNPILENIRSERGLTEFKVEVDGSVESLSRKELRCRIKIKPTLALEYIILEFGITDQGATFDNI